MPFTCDDAKTLNQEIFETIYFAALTASMEEAIKEGAYKSYKGSPISKGEFQHNMWGIKDDELSGRWDWDGLRKEIKKNGVRNSLLVAPMPLMGNFSFSPHSCLRIFGHKKIVDNLCKGYRPITEPSKGIFDFKVV